MRAHKARTAVYLHSVQSLACLEAVAVVGATLPPLAHRVAQVVVLPTPEQSVLVRLVRATTGAAGLIQTPEAGAAAVAASVLMALLVTAATAAMAALRPSVALLRHTQVAEAVKELQREDQAAQVGAARARLQEQERPEQRIQAAVVAARRGRTRAALAAPVS